MKFTEAFIIVRAVLLFCPPVWGKKIHLWNRSALLNTSSSTSSSITSGSSSSATITKHACNDDYAWYDCDPIVNGFDGMGFCPYNTTEFPYNIVPPNTSIASLCASSWTNSVISYYATAAVYTVTNTWDTSVDAFDEQIFTWAPEYPCCLNCTILGGAITVMVWPTPAPDPPVPTLIDTAANFTFISPSVYVVFQSIGATDLCGAVGGSYTNTTLAFEPDALSTQRNYYAATSYPESDLGDLDSDYCTHATPNQGWSTFDYLADEAGKCTEITTSWYTIYYSNDTAMYSAQSDLAKALSTEHVSCGFGCEGMPLDEFICVYNPCSPWVSVPTQVYGLDPKFHTCMDGIKAFFDPPYTLTTGNGLVAFTTATNSPSTSSSAKPAPTPGSVIASSTAPPAFPQPTRTSPQVPGNPQSTSSNAVIGNQNTQSASTPVTEKVPPTEQGDPPSSSVDPIVPFTTIGSIIVSQAPSSNFIIGSKTLAQGQALTVGSNTFSLAPDGTAIIIDGSTAVLAPPANMLSATAGPHFIISSGTTLLLVGSQTILPGSSAIVVSGTTYSVAPSGNVVVVDGTSEYLIRSQTLVAVGSAITVSGAAISLESGGQIVVVGGSTEVISSFLATGSSGLGAAILTIGGFGSSSSVGEVSSTAGSYNGAVFASRARRMSSMTDQAVMYVGAAWLACLGAVWML